MNPLTPINFAAAQFRADLPASVGQKLTSIPPASLQELPKDLGAAPAAQSDSFSTMLGRMVQDVNLRQNAASETVSGLLAGQNVNLHQAMLAVEEASLSFQLMVEVRNRLLESYQEIMRMQV